MVRIHHPVALFATNSAALCSSIWSMVDGFAVDNLAMMSYLKLNSPNSFWIEDAYFFILSQHVKDNASANHPGLYCHCITSQCRKCRHRIGDGISILTYCSTLCAVPVNPS